MKKGWKGPGVLHGKRWPEKHWPYTKRYALKGEQNKGSYLLRALELYPLDPGLALHRAVEAKLFADQEIKTPLLDMGCSDGNFAKIWLKSKTLEKGSDLAIGLDSIPSTLKDMCHGYVYHDTLAGDALRLPFKNETFNTVISNSVMTHIKELAAVMGEVHRVLHFPGIFIFTVPSCHFGEYLVPCQILDKLDLHYLSLRIASRYNRKWEQKHILPLKIWEELLSENGFCLRQSTSYLSAAASFWWSLYFFVARLRLYRWEIKRLMLRFFHRIRFSYDGLTTLLYRSLFPYYEEDLEFNGGSLFLVAEKC